GTGSSGKRTGIAGRAGRGRSVSGGATQTAPPARSLRGSRPAANAEHAARLRSQLSSHRQLHGRPSALPRQGTGPRLKDRVLGWLLDWRLWLALAAGPVVWIVLALIVYPDLHPGRMLG